MRWERRQNGEKERGERAQVHEMDKTERGREGKRAHVYEMEYAHVDRLRARGKGSPHSPNLVA